VTPNSAIGTYFANYLQKTFPNHFTEIPVDKTTINSAADLASVYENLSNNFNIANKFSSSGSLLQSVNYQNYLICIDTDSLCYAVVDVDIAEQIKRLDE